jgi:Alpha/beta hydrolase of unknown function (DUF900)
MAYLAALTRAIAPGQAEATAEKLVELLERSEERKPGVDYQILELLAKFKKSQEWMRAAIAPPRRVERSGQFKVKTQQAEYVRVKILYATDRKPTGKNEPENFYAGVRADDEKLSFGTCEVSIPKSHSRGHVETPAWHKFQFKPHPHRHVVLLSVKPAGGDEFFRDVSGVVEQSEGKDTFVFLHGYRVTFEDAARRTAQLAYDLPFRGAPILYSWPSRGRILTYNQDEQEVEWTVPHLKQFLIDVSARTGGETDSSDCAQHGEPRACRRAKGDVARGSQAGELPPCRADRARYRCWSLQAARKPGSWHGGTRDSVRLEQGYGPVVLAALPWLCEGGGRGRWIGCSALPGYGGCIGRGHEFSGTLIFRQQSNGVVGYLFASAGPAAGEAARP